MYKKRVKFEIEPIIIITLIVRETEQKKAC